MSEQSFRGRTSTGEVEIGTPDEIFLPLHQEFNFTFDLAANHQPWLHKCERYWTKADNSLTRDWPRTPVGEANWLNPPYSRSVWKWIAKARQQAAEGSSTIVLVNANTESQWFQHIAVPFAHDIRLLEYRAAFIKDGVQMDGGYHPSCVLVFLSNTLGIPIPIRARGGRNTDYPRFNYVSF